MARSKEKEQAFVFRRRGMSISDIAKNLRVSKSTVSIWCRDIVLTRRQRENLRTFQIKAGHSGRVIGAEMNRHKKLMKIASYRKEASKTIRSFSKRDLLMMGIGLYWGEGTKTNNSTTAIVNSDPSLILFAKRWFEECLGVKQESFHPYIYISEIHKPRAKKIVVFWSSLLGLPKAQFHNIIFIKGRPKKVYENHDSYYGVLVLRVYKGSDLKYRILELLSASKQVAGVAQW